MPSSIIEQAVRRLEELRRSGIQVPDTVRGNAASGVISGELADPADAAVKPTPSLRRADAPAKPGPAQVPVKASKTVQVDFAALAKLGYLTPDAPRSRLAEEFRVVKRPLLRNIYGTDAAALQRPQLLMVTSSVPGEGKTFVSVNLAISLAMELDTTVLLVDGDVARPSILKRLGLAQAAGLLDLLTDPSIQMSDVLLRTNIDKLALLPAGSAHGRATELLASESMNRLLDEIANRYPDRVIVFDAPPLLPSTESRVLATRMGQVVFVVEAEKTPQKAVSQALAALENCPMVMPLLNKVSKSDVGAYYGYYDTDER